VTHALTAHLGLRDFNAALLADHAAVLKAFVLAAQAFVVLDRAKNLGAEQAVTLGLEGTVVDGLGLLTSPKDQERIFSGEARPILMASKCSSGVNCLNRSSSDFMIGVP